jgi:hypothetical protein
MDEEAGKPKTKLMKYPNVDLSVAAYKKLVAEKTAAGYDVPLQSEHRVRPGSQ